MCLQFSNMFDKTLKKVLSESTFKNILLRSYVDFLFSWHQKRVDFFDYIIYLIDNIS